MTVKEYMESTYNPGNVFLLRPRISCVDGFSVSVQGGTEYHYCEPRQHVNEYIEVELGFPTESDETILKYAESPGKPTETVYAYVPIEVVEELIAKHGGIKS